MSPPWMLIRLALETRAHHPWADEDRLRLMDATSRADYRAYLVRLYGFEAPVESALARMTEVDPELVRDRFKVDRLRDDLVALGLNQEVIDWIPRVPSVNIRSGAQAMGWLYVLERSTLLSGLVRRHVQRTLGVEQLGGALHYLSTAAPGARFRELGEALCRSARRYTPRAIIAAANEAFRAQRQWMLGLPRFEAAKTLCRQPAALCAGA